MRVEEEGVWTARFGGRGVKTGCEDHVCKRVELEGKHGVVHACNPSIWGVEAGRTGVQAHFQL